MTSVYLVDDHVMYCDALRVFLAEHGITVVGQSSDPTQAMSEIRQTAPDLLLLDINLGHHSGFELLTGMRRRALKTRTLVVTMSDLPRHVAEALRLGAEGYVLKGSSAAELLRAIRSVHLGGRHYVDEVAELAVKALATRDDDVAMNGLSARERQVVLLVVRGQSSAQIGAALHLSPKTIDSYRSRLMAKLGLTDLPALVRFALRTGLIGADDL